MLTIFDSIIDDNRINQNQFTMIIIIFIVPVVDQGIIVKFIMVFITIEFYCYFIVLPFAFINVAIIKKFNYLFNIINFEIVIIKIVIINFGNYYFDCNINLNVETSIIITTTFIITIINKKLDIEFTTTINIIILICFKQVSLNQQLQKFLFKIKIWCINFIIVVALMFILFIIIVEKLINLVQCSYNKKFIIIMVIVFAILVIVMSFILIEIINIIIS